MSLYDVHFAILPASKIKGWGKKEKILLREYARGNPFDLLDVSDEDNCSYWEQIEIREFESRISIKYNEIFKSDNRTVYGVRGSLEFTFYESEAFLKVRLSNMDKHLILCALDTLEESECVVVSEDTGLVLGVDRVGFFNELSNSRAAEALVNPMMVLDDYRVGGGKKTQQ